VKIWDAAMARLRSQTHLPYNVDQGSLAFSPDGTLLAVGHRQVTMDGGLIQLLDPGTGKVLRKLEVATGRVPVVLAFAPDGKTVAAAYGGTGTPGGGARLWDVETGNHVRTMGGHKSLALALRFSPDGKFLATAGDQHDRSVRLWDVASGKEVRQFQGPRGAVRSVTFSPDGRWLAAADPDGGQLLRWDMRTGMPLEPLRGIRGVFTVLYSPSGKWIAMASRVDREQKTGEVRLFDAVVSGRALRTWANTMTNAIAFAPDERVLATAHPDGTVKLWELSGIGDGN
jgi:WD40 repeat protein